MKEINFEEISKFLPSCVETFIIEVWQGHEFGELFKKGLSKLEEFFDDWYSSARSDSQRLKNKNVRSLNGKPLVFYTLEAFLGSNDVEKVIFTADSQQ